MSPFTITHSEMKKLNLDIVLFNSSKKVTEEFAGVKIIIHEYQTQLINAVGQIQESCCREV